ncbi:MAG: general secretion pathway protein GspL, partial [Rhodoferax sp.]|nr:general secretion pathway protein GspL [Rhodoferax sp.]
HLQALEAAGRRVARIVPEFEPDTGPLQVHLTGEPDMAQLVATGGGISGVLHVPFSAAALSLLPVPEADQAVLIAAEPAVAALAEEMIQGKVSLLTRAERWLDSARSPWDIAQFDLSSSGRARTVKRLSGAGRTLLQAPGLRPARWGMAALVAANLLGLNAWAWKEQSALKAKQETVRSTLTQAFPQVRVVVDAPVQMEREVASLRQATGAVSSRDLESMLAALGSATPSDKSLSAIDYSAGQARLKGIALAEQDAPALMALKALGYNTQQEADTLVMRPQTTAEVSK